jgi:hypothetical protein
MSCQRTHNNARNDNRGMVACVHVHFAHLLQWRRASFRDGSRERARGPLRLDAGYATPSSRAPRRRPNRTLAAAAACSKTKMHEMALRFLIRVRRRALFSEPHTRSSFRAADA